MSAGARFWRGCLPGPELFDVQMTIQTPFPGTPLYRRLRREGRLRYAGHWGLAFLVASGQLSEWCQVTPPNHVGYVQFPAALLLVLGLMFVAVAWDPPGRRNLIAYGILLKVAYCGVAGFQWAAGGIPGMWKPFVGIDLLMGLLFAWAYASLAKRPPSTP